MLEVNYQRGQARQAFCAIEITKPRHRNKCEGGFFDGLAAAALLLQTTGTAWLFKPMRACAFAQAGDVKCRAWPST